MTTAGLLAGVAGLDIIGGIIGDNICGIMYMGCGGGGDGEEGEGAVGGVYVSGMLEMAKGKDGTSEAASGPLDRAPRRSVKYSSMAACTCCC